MNFESLKSSTARRMKPSIIRSLLSLVSKGDVISFAGGTPDAALFPLAEMSEIARKVVLEQGRFALQYGETIGWRKLREQVSAYLAGKGVKAEPDEILITTGSQQGIDLACRVFLDEGDRVGVENPSYLGALNAFMAYKADLVPLAMDTDGLIPESLEEACKAGRAPKLLYLTPSFQNPSGRLLSDARRRRIATLAAEKGILVLEDDPYGEINFGHPFSPLKTYDQNGNVLYFGSFSKISTPGLRLGWVAGPREAIGAMTLAKETADVCSSVLAQAVAAELMASGLLGPHLDKLRAAYKSRAFAMLEALKAEGLPIDAEAPKGGFFLWGKLRRGGDASALFERAVAAGVAYVPGEAFHPVPGEGKDTLRLTFCAVDEDRIREGVKRLAGVLAGVGA